MTRFVNLMIVRLAIAMAVFCGGFFLISRAERHEAKVPSGSTDHFANNGLRKAVNTLQHPNAEYYNGKTYIAFQGPGEDPYVCSYDHDSNVWMGPIRAGKNLLGKKPVVDNHGIPALFVDNSGYIHVIFGGHGGAKGFGKNPLGKNGSGAQIHVVSERPEDISTWSELSNIPPFGTYPQIVKVGREIYLFYRHGSHQSDWVYQKSKDDGRTFSEPISILKNKAAARGPGLHDAWYAVFNKGKGNTIVCAYVYHECGDGDLHDKEGRFNMYFMRMDCDAGGSWETVTGEEIEIPITFEKANRSTLVFKTGREKLSASSCYDDSRGYPMILYRGRNRQEVNFTRWDERGWQPASLVIENGIGEAAELIATSDQNLEVITGGQSGDGQEAELAIYSSKDGGLSWEKSAIIQRGSEIGYSLGSRVLNGRPDAYLVFSQSPSLSDDGKPSRSLENGILNEGGYGELFLWGEDGFVKRTKQPEQ